MFCVEIFLPVTEGEAFAESLAQLRQELTEQFGGVTAFSRAPARGVWRSETGSHEADDIIVVATMADELDRTFWKALQRKLEASLRQDEILIRAYAVELI